MREKQDSCGGCSKKAPFYYFDETIWVELEKDDTDVLYDVHDFVTAVAPNDVARYLIVENVRVN